MPGPKVRMVLIALLLGAGLNLSSAERRDRNSNAPNDPSVARRAQELTSSNAVQAAAAAYWLGQHSAAAVATVPQLVAVLGDNRSVDPSLYRQEPRAVLPRRSSPGQEAAAALVHIGEPAVDALIRALQTSTSAIARQNAAWALGQIGETKPDGKAAVPRPTQEQYN